MDRESQITAIEKTFEDLKQPIEEHYSKKGDEMWKYPCAQAMIGVVMDESGEQFVSYPHMPLSGNIEI